MDFDHNLPKPDPRESQWTFTKIAILVIGLIALIVEEAALSAGAGGTLASMTLRYMRGVRVGPGVATATVRGDVADVEVTDGGRDGVLAVLATTRSFPCGGGAR